METAIGIARPGGAVGRVGVPQHTEIPGSLPAFFGSITIGGGPAPVRAYIDEHQRGPCRPPRERALLPAGPDFARKNGRHEHHAVIQRDRADCDPGRQRDDAGLPVAAAAQRLPGTDKISDLPRRRSTAGAPEGVDPDVGDITYYAPWGNLAIFYRDLGHSRGLIDLGRIDSGVEALAGSSGDFTVTITRSDEPAG
jgi:hypothetical protein